jgi:putative ABC transport system permease protein
MFRHYLLTACKVFMRRKLFTAINLLCIVLTLVVLMVVTALLETAFFPTGVEGKSDRFLQVVMMQSTSPKGDAVRITPIGYRLIEQHFKPMASLERVGVVTMPSTVSVYQDGRVSELQMRRADADYWKVLDFTLLAGRLPTLEDEQQARFVAVLNRSSAARLFGSASAIGQSVSVSGQRLQVIGVVEDEMHMNAYADIWAPVTTSPSSEYKHQMSGNFVALLLARDSADLPQIRREVAAAARNLVFEDPANWNQARFWADSKLDAAARLLLSNIDQEDSGAGMLLATVGALMFAFMLLPALNLINLNTGRILERSSEIGVRKAFGATSMQLVGQFIIENVLLCVAGGVLGLAGAQLALYWIEQAHLIPYLKVSINLAVMGYGLLITLVFGLLSGVVPAWKMSRLDPVHALKGAI